MADQFIQVPTDSSGKKVDTSELTVGANTVERQRIVVADPTTAANLATVTAAGALKVDSSATTQPISGNVGQGTAASLGAAWPVEVTDGSNVLATATHPARVDPTGTTTQPVSGTVTANAGTGTFNSSDANAQAQGSTTSGQKGFLELGAVTTNAPVYTTAQSSPISLDTSGLLRVSVKDTPQNANAFRVDGSAITQPISAASLPLPSGAATSAKQPALGTAGSASSDVLSVQGIASMTPLNVDGSGVTQPVSGTVTVGNSTLAVTESGTWNVGLNAGTNLIGISSSPNETSTIYNGTTALTPSFATIVASASGATTIVSAVASKRIRVLAMQLVANAAVNVKWQSHTTPTDLTGLAYLAANGGYVLPFNPVGWFQTNSGEALDINLSSAVAVGGSITYIAV